MNDLRDELIRISPALNNLRQSSSATFSYYAACDAIVWSDELPSSANSDDLAICYLLKYRTSLLTGEPIIAIEPYWQIARCEFPNWPGFAPDRCTPTPALAEAIKDMRTKFDAFLETANSWPAFSTTEPEKK